MLIYIILVLICVNLWVLWMKVLRKGSGPLAKGTLPVLGYTHKVIGDTEKLWNVFEEASFDSLEKGGLSRAIIALQTFYVVTDPDDLTTIGNNVVLKHYSFDFSMRWLGDGLVTAPTQVWKHHRRLLNPAFGLHLLHGFLPVFNEQARELADSLAKEVDKGPIDLSEYFRENAMKALSQTAMGLSKKVKSGFFRKYIEAADTLLQMFVTRFQKVWLHLDFVYKLSGLMRKEDVLIELLNGMSDEVIAEKRTQINDFSVNDEQYASTSTGQKNKAYLDLLLELASTDVITEVDVREEVDTMLVAGTDPPSWTITYVFVLLGSHPRVQQKVLDEITQVLGDSDRDLTKEDLQKLVYTEAVIKETARLYPAVAFSLRTVENELKLKDHSLQPGDHVVMSFYGVNRHPSWGADANQFRPERWLEGNYQPNAFAGFGVGKRNCIGKTYGIFAIKTILSHVLRRYHVTGDVSKMKLKLDFITKPVTGHLVSITERNQRSEKIRKQA